MTDSTWPALTDVASFSFSLFAFLASFCLSVYVLDGLGLSLWSAAAKRIKLRPYSPTFSKLEKQLQKACTSEDSEIWCLRNKRLSVHEFKELVVPLLGNVKVRRWRSLHLEGNDFGEDGCEALFKSLQAESCVCNLEFLSLKQCSVAHLPPSLREYLRNDSSSLRNLDLSGNDLDDDQVVRLASCLSSSQLRMLDLSRNKLTFACLERLGKAIANSRIADLRLRGNSIGDEGITLFTQHALSPGSPLRFLDVSASALTDEGVLSMAPRMKTSLLHQLNLMDNPRISDRSIVPLARNLQSLRVLNVSHLLRVTDKSLYALSESAKRSLLKRILWFGINVTPECELEMARIFYMVSSRSFQLIITLCSVLDVPRVGSKSKLRLLNKDLIRMAVEKLVSS